MTYVDLVRFVSPESGNDYLPYASLPTGDLIRVDVPGRLGNSRDEGGAGSMAGRPEDGHTFKRLFETRWSLY